jgi:hypothetical protein
MLRLAGWTLVALALAGLASPELSGQQPRYTPPAGPVLPSALNFFRFDSGVLDNYNGIVRPANQLNYQLNTMAAREQADFRSMERSLSQMRAAEAAATGVGAGFMNYSHYYPMRAGGARTARR